MSCGHTSVLQVLSAWLTPVYLTPLHASSELKWLYTCVFVSWFAYCLLLTYSHPSIVVCVLGSECLGLRLLSTMPSCRVHATDNIIVPTIDIRHRLGLLSICVEDPVETSSISDEPVDLGLRTHCVISCNKALAVESSLSSLQIFAFSASFAAKIFASCSSMRSSFLTSKKAGQK